MKSVYSFLILLSALNPSFALAQDAFATLKFSNGTQAQLFWDVEPLVGKEAVMRVEFQNANGQPVDGKINGVEVVNAGTVSGGAVKIEPALDIYGDAELGIYRVSGLSFSVNGDWEVRVRVWINDATEDVQSVALHL